MALVMCQLCPDCVPLHVPFCPRPVDMKPTSFSLSCFLMSRVSSSLSITADATRPAKAPLEHVENVYIRLVLLTILFVRLNAFLSGRLYY
ncbi:hypothetical protein OUZ56_013826 [Daphnia magna]|uniref:Uncharacterized protein n=1 Tax=Daphnia magna TaxID=35525 RepID=A0ABQ9Z712_9CRUS|nr:hypothetical protein OUZ56_013826 [Daphnia magna]